MSRTKDLTTMIFRCSAGYVRTALARHLLRPRIPKRWTEFQRRYRAELEASPAAESLRALARRAADETVTLVFSSRDAEHNNAVVLKARLDALARRIRRPTYRRTARG
jgi:hypothetical protein